MEAIIIAVIVFGCAALISFITDSHVKYEDECRRYEGKLHAERIAREMKQDESKPAKPDNR